MTLFSIYICVSTQNVAAEPDTRITGNLIYFRRNSSYQIPISVSCRPACVQNMKKKAKAP